MFSGETPVFGEAGVRSQSITSRAESPKGNGRRSAASARAKIALLAPIPSASVSAVMAVNPGAAINCRAARRTSLRTSSTHRIGGCPPALA
jgi:hypothetical protein